MHFIIKIKKHNLFLHLQSTLCFFSSFLHKFIFVFALTLFILTHERSVAGY